MEASITITQDQVDFLRQEYIDFNAPWVPDPYMFDTSSPYYWKLLDPPDVDWGRHEPWHILANVNWYAYDTEWFYGGAVNFTSGYRCPTGNKRANGALDSNHMYGRAFDFVQYSYQSFLDVAYAAYNYVWLNVLLHKPGEPNNLYHRFPDDIPDAIDRAHAEWYW